MSQIGKRDDVESGFFAILFSQQRVQTVPDETSFLAYYKIEKLNKHMEVKLVGLYPSRDILRFPVSQFWFSNNAEPES